MPRRKMLNLKQILSLVDEFMESPKDKIVQVKILDVAQHFPITWSYLLAQKHKECLLAMPYYVTLEKMEADLMVCNKREAKSLLAELKKQYDEVHVDTTDTFIEETDKPISLDEFSESSEDIIELDVIPLVEETDVKKQRENNIIQELRKDATATALSEKNDADLAIRAAADKRMLEEKDFYDDFDLEKMLDTE